MRRHVNVANLLTSASLSAAVVALMLASEARLAWAGALLVLAAVLDGLDGLAARRLGSSGRFGCELDSLADLVAFGVVPALMLHEGPLASAPVTGGAACVVFAVAGAWRLARFPLVEHARHWVGLPIPTAGLVAAAAAVLGLGDGVAIALLLVLAGLMVSAIRFPTVAALTRRPAPPSARAAAGHGDAREPQRLDPAARERVLLGD